MDTTKATHIGLCAGYGGIELGLKRVIPTLRSVALCEIEAFACANLVAKMEAGLMDAAPIWTDLKTFPYEEFRDRVDILTGGYPCQPFSAAGKRGGKDDPRHLWPWIADGIRILRPRMCFFENVEGHISLGLSSVISDLEELGYQVSWGIFSAREVGAPHQRKRVFILAYSIGDGHDWRKLQDHLEGWSSGQLPQPHAGESCGLWGETSGCCQVWPSRPGEPQHAWEPPRVVGSRMANSNELRLEEHGLQHTGLSIGSSGGQNAEAMANSESKRTRRRSELCSEECGQGRTLPREFEQPDQAMGNSLLAGGVGGGRNEAEPDSYGAHNRVFTQDAEYPISQTQSPLGRDTHGSADWMVHAELHTTCDNRTDELRLLGNGVVPATAERAFRTLLKELYGN